MLNVHIQRYAVAGLRLLTSLCAAAAPLIYRSIRGYASWALVVLLLADNAAHAWSNDAALSMSVAQTVQQRFHVPAGSMKRVLDRFEDQSGLRFIYDANLIENANSIGLNGRYAPMLALEMLLTCTGVSYHFISGNTVMLRRFVMAPPIQLPGNIGSTQ